MSQLQAVGLVVAFAMALALTVTILLFITALVYEARGWWSRRPRHIRDRVGHYTIAGRARRDFDADHRQVGALMTRNEARALEGLPRITERAPRARVGMSGRWSN